MHSVGVGDILEHVSKVVGQDDTVPVEEGAVTGLSDPGGKKQTAQSAMSFPGHMYTSTNIILCKHQTIEIIYLLRYVIHVPVTCIRLKEYALNAMC